MELKGRTVLVTGGAVRIGRAICTAFAEAGAKLAIHYNSSEKEALSLLKKLGGNRAGHRTVRCELSDFEATAALIASCGKVDILVNNASIYMPCPFSIEKPEDARLQWDINFRAPMILMKQFHAQKIKQGCIINILDRRITKSFPDDGSYSMSKKALAQSTTTAALQWAPRIRVNAVAPGAVLPPKFMPGSKMKKQIAMTPMKKAPRPEDVANACIFLAESDSITGQVIFVDGGQHL